MKREGNHLMLIAMAGVPGAGKSTLAAALAAALPASVLSVDPVEAALWRAGVDRSQPTGLAAYVVVEALAAEQLHVGHAVIVDAVNDAAPAREQWVGLARHFGVALRFIEVVCSDAITHRRRLESRRRDIDGMPEPRWTSVEDRRRALECWTGERLVLDSMNALQSNVDLALEYLRT